MYVLMVLSIGFDGVLRCSGCREEACRVEGVG